MTDCQEGILVNLGTPLENSPAMSFPGKTPLENSPVMSFPDSISILRDDPYDRLENIPKVSSPLKGSEKLLMDISTRSNTSDQLSPLKFIEDETFDFDLPATPETNSDRSIPEDDEEEVFFGPVGFHERCVSTVVKSASKERKPLSPLNSRQIAEICREANVVAKRISKAASGKKSKDRPKDNLICGQKLRLDKAIFDKETVGTLLKSVKRIQTSDTDDEDKENCDKLQAMDVDGSDENINCLEAFLRNDVTDSKMETKSSSSENEEVTESKMETKSSSSENEDVTESKMETKSSSSENEFCESPAKRHNRSGTYTLEVTPHDLLPADKRKSLPVVGMSSDENLLSVKPKEEDKGRRSISKLQQPVSKLSKSSGLKGPKPVTKVENKEASTASSSSKPQVKSRLSAPKAGSLLPSKLQGPAVTNSSVTISKSSIPAKPANQIPQKSAISGPKGRGAPISKLQLMKPSRLQRPGVAPTKNGDSTKKNGPMKAFVPVQTQEMEKVPVEITPAKVEKKVLPKNLSSSFSTPTKSSGSTSSIESPLSLVKKRRSFLPTPTKSSVGSTSSIGSPCPSRTSSTSSQRSLDSPFTRGSSMGTRSSIKLGGLDLLDDSSPSVMRPKRPLVTNTPNMPKKKLSQWSPVQKKKPHDLIDQAIMCTKKIRK